MEKELGILVLHGMGSPEHDFAEKMIEEIDDRLKAMDVKVETRAWEPVYWADIIEGNELDYLRNVEQQGYDLDFKDLREFVVRSLGDAVAYQRTMNPSNNTYSEVNGRVASSMERLHSKLGGKDKPLIIMAHSLGGHVVSNYIWDIQHQKGGSGFLKFETMKRIITFGCNLPLFSFAHTAPQAINLPNGCEWYNYYDKDDVLGYPLKPISSSYYNTVKEDIEINVGNALTSWHMSSHLGYWTDNDFTTAAAQHIRDTF